MKYKLILFSGKRSRLVPFTYTDRSRYTSMECSTGQTTIVVTDSSDDTQGYSQRVAHNSQVQIGTQMSILITMDTSTMTLTWTLMKQVI